MDALGGNLVQGRWLGLPVVGHFEILAGWDQAERRRYSDAASIPALSARQVVGGFEIKPHSL